MTQILLATVLNLVGTNLVECADYPVNLTTDRGVILNFNLADKNSHEAHGWFALDENKPAPRVGYDYVQAGYERTSDGYRRVWEEREMPKPPVRYSVKKVISSLRAAGKWATVKAALIAADYYEEFLGSNYLAADDTDFKAALAGLVSAGVMTQEEIDTLLASCHWEAD